MAQRLLLEGSDIDELLLRVRTEHGPDARIVHAERKLVGGWAGFFAKRRYEVAIAVDETAPLAAATEAAAPVAEPLISHVPAPAAPSHEFSPALSSAMSSAMSTAMSSAMSSSTSSVMSSVMSMSGSPATAFSFAEPSGAMTEPHPTSALDDLLADADARDGGVRTSGRLLSTESDTFDDLVRDLVARAAPESRPFEVSDFAPATPRVVGMPDATTSALAIEPGVKPQPEPQPEPELPEQRHVRELGPRALAGGTPRARLVTPGVARLGLPVEPVSVDDDRLSLLEVLDEVAVKAPRRLVGVQVLVGDGEAVRALAAAWARTTGADPSAVLDLESAESRVDDDPQSRQELLQCLAREHGGVLVVLPAGDATTDAEQAAQTVVELGQCTVTATVDARWTASRTKPWLAALASAGRAADRLAAYEIHQTPDPLGLLEHGLPVTWLDSRPATIGAWASPCLDRWQ